MFCNVFQNGLGSGLFASLTGHLLGDFSHSQGNRLGGSIFPDNVVLGSVEDYSVPVIN